MALFGSRSRKHSDDGTASSHDTASQEASLDKHGRPKRKFRWRRFLIISAVIFVICTLTISLPIIYVGYPRIAQSEVNKAGAAIFGQRYTDTTPDSLHLHLEAAVLSKAHYSPYLDSWNASLYLRGRTKPFTVITIPVISNAKNGTVFTIDQKLDLADAEETLEYTKALIAQETVAIGIVGRGGLKQDGLFHIDVNYNLTSTFKGFNGLSGVTVSNLRLSSGNSTLPYNANAAGNVTVPNPSNLTVEMGDVYLNMSVAGTPIGFTTLPDFTITPGNATYPLYATVDEVAVAGVLALPKYRCGTIDVSLAGTRNGSVNDGQIIPYTTQALEAEPLHVSINLTDTLNAAGLGGLITGACQS